jgi:hypothetical protein
MHLSFKSSAWSYLIGNMVYIGPHVIYGGVGGRRENHPVESVRLDDSAAIQKAICYALSGFRSIDAPAAEAQRKFVQPILASAKIKSSKDLMKVAKYVGILEWPDGRVQFSPTRNGGPRIGYSIIMPNEEVIRQEDFSTALRTAFDRCVD